MTQPTKPTPNFSLSLERWRNHQTWCLAKHWLFVANVLVGTYVGLPYLAPLLMHYGYTTPASAIYRVFGMTCHQYPSRSYFIFGHQAGLCHRCSAIWAAIFIGGLIFIFLRPRLKPMPFHWWILALIPVGLDGGTQLVGPFYEVLPEKGLTGFAIIVWLVLTVILIMCKVSHWQYYLFVFCFPAGMMFVQFTGTRLSNWPLRTMTGSILGLAYVWLLFPMLEETSQDVQERLGE